MAWPYVEVIWIKSECRVAVLIISLWHLELHIFVGNILLLIIHPGQQTRGSTEWPRYEGPDIPTVREGEMDDKATYENLQRHIPRNPHHLATDEGMAAVRPDAQVEFDLLRRVCEHIADVHGPTVEIDRLGLVVEEEPDVRNEERLFHKLLIEH